MTIGGLCSTGSYLLGDLLGDLEMVFFGFLGGEGAYFYLCCYIFGEF